MNKKSAFTLTEILIMLTIIGFIMVAQLVVLNSKVNQYSGAYYTVYNAIRKTAYNVLADIYCPCKDPNCPDAACKAGPRAFPTDSKNLCKRFAEFINTAENNCDNQTLIDESLNFKNATPAFIATNSFRFYFYKNRLTSTVGGKKVNYFITFVDLNGEKRPNRFVCDDTDVLPDIIPFIITDSGDVIPVGLPVYSKAYMTATVGVSTADPSEKTKAMAFKDAVLTAWPNNANRENINIPFSVDYSNYLSTSMKTNFNSCTDGNKKKVDYINQSLNDSKLGCHSGTYDCRVTIDKHKTTRF